MRATRPRRVRPQKLPVEEIQIEAAACGDVEDEARGASRGPDSHSPSSRTCDEDCDDDYDEETPAVDSTADAEGRAELPLCAPLGVAASMCTLTTAAAASAMLLFAAGGLLLLQPSLLPSASSSFSSGSPAAEAQPASPLHASLPPPPPLPPSGFPPPLAAPSPPPHAPHPAPIPRRPPPPSHAPRPPPHAPPRPPSPSPPPLQVTWTKHGTTRCWEDGHGARLVDAAGVAVPGVSTEPRCRESCTRSLGATDGATGTGRWACHGVVFNRWTRRCFRYADFVMGFCDRDPCCDVFLRVDPHVPPPPSTPPLAPYPLVLNAANGLWVDGKPPSLEEIGSARGLNLRFRSGRNDRDDLFEAGLLVHQFDFMDDGDPRGVPWVPGKGDWMAWEQSEGGQWNYVQRPTWPMGDRISAAIINAQMTREPSGNIPIFSPGLAGLILSPFHNRLLCSHAYDADSIKRRCEPRGVSEHCLPGCTLDVPPSSSRHWCTDIHKTDQQFPCAWRPSETSQMLQAREALRRAKHQPPDPP